MCTRHVLELPVPNFWIAPLDQWNTRLRAAGSSESTIYTRIRHMRRVAREFGDRLPTEVTPHDLLSWCGQQEWKPETRRSYYCSIRLFFGTIDGGPGWEDPSRILPSVRCGPGTPRPAPDWALRSGILRDDCDDRTKRILALAASAGLRAIEIARLNVNDVWLGPHGYMLTVNGKGSKVRHVPIEEWLAFDLLLTGGGFADGWIFPGQIGGHLSERWVGRLAARALPAHWTLHTLRHWYGVHTYAARHDLRAVQELLGHASISTTQRYTLPSDESLRASAKGADLRRLFDDDAFPWTDRPVA